MAKKNIKPRVRVPRSVKKGEAFEVKSLVTHPMDTGTRKDKATGKMIPRDIINQMLVTYGGKEVLKCKWHPSVSANPYSSFYVVATESGPMDFTWRDDAGNLYTKSVKVKVG